MLELFESTCPDCGKSLTLEDRHRPIQTTYPQFREYCMGCATVRQKKWKSEKGKAHYQRVKSDADSYTQHRKRLQRNHWKRTYGISDEEYQAFFDAQHGLCASCGRPETWIDERSGLPRELAVDHDHKTDKVRCLLCRACNVSFGLLEEDPELIASLLEFARKRKEESS